MLAGEDEEDEAELEVGPPEHERRQTIAEDSHYVSFRA
jgi:hypothetical protein